MRGFACNRMSSAPPPLTNFSSWLPLLCLALASYLMVDFDNSHTVDTKQPILKSGRQDYKFTLKKT